MKTLDVTLFVPKEGPLLPSVLRIAGEFCKVFEIEQITSHKNQWAYNAKVETKANEHTN